jgi:hypothetical protein
MSAKIPLRFIKIPPGSDIILLITAYSLIEYGRLLTFKNQAYPASRGDRIKVENFNNGKCANFCIISGINVGQCANRIRRFAQYPDRF